MGAPPDMLLGRSWIPRTFLRSSSASLSPGIVQDLPKDAPLAVAVRKVLDIQDLPKELPETHPTFLRTYRRRGGPTGHALRKVLDIQDLPKQVPAAAAS